MLRIHQALQSGTTPSATVLARDLEVSTKSIYRDLDFMRDRLGLPVAYDPQRHGFHYTADVTSFPTLQITEGELFALLVAEKALQQYRGTHFEQPLVSAFRKMAAALPETISLNLAEWEHTISFRTSAEPILDLEIFDTLAQATARRQQLELQYRKPGRREAEPRLIDPYHLANINGEWFLFAYDHLRRDLRTFVPARIRSARRTGATFSPPNRFDLERRLRDSFGVVAGHEHFEVVIRFDETAADYIREKKWHASQRLREMRDGGVELRLRLSSLAEVQRWILGWGGSATVLRPAALRKAVAAAGARIAQRHA